MIYKKITNKLPTLAGILLTGMIAGCEGCKKEGKAEAAVQEGLGSAHRATLEGQKQTLLNNDLFPEVRIAQLLKQSEVKDIIKAVPRQENYNNLASQFGYKSNDDTAFRVHLKKQPVKDLDSRKGSLFEGMAKDVKDELIKFVQDTKRKHGGSIGMQALLHVVDQYNAAALLLYELEQGKRGIKDVVEQFKKITEEQLNEEFTIVRLSDISSILHKGIFEDIIGLTSKDGRPGRNPGRVFSEYKEAYKCVNADKTAFLDKKGSLAQAIEAISGQKIDDDDILSLIQETSFFGLLAPSENQNRLKMKAGFEEVLASKDRFIEKIIEYGKFRSYKDVNGQKQVLSDESANLLKALRKSMESTDPISVDGGKQAGVLLKETIFEFAKNLALEIAKVKSNAAKAKKATLENAFAGNDKGGLDLGAIQKFFNQKLKTLKEYVDKVDVTEQGIVEFAQAGNGSDRFKLSFKMYQELVNMIASNSSEATESTKEEENKEEENKK